MVTFIQATTSDGNDQESLDHTKAIKLLALEGIQKCDPAFVQNTLLAFSKCQ
jgi:hypothetical protein